MAADEERIALFLDYENLAIGARDQGLQFDLRPVADALAERGRVVVRKAYAEWSSFADDSRMLVRHNVELIEIPQRMGAVRKNAADIKMAVDAIELAFERGYLTTFVIGTGDSDFTPLVHKLRSLDKQVIGVGVKESTSALLPPACDEFLFYERLKGVEAPAKSRTKKETIEPEEPQENGSLDDLIPLVTQTLSGLQSTYGGAVVASSLKRAILRKDPTFSESDYGFRGFGELLRHLESSGAIELGEGPARGDPVVSFSEKGQGEEGAFALLRKVVADAQSAGSFPLLSGLKNQLRKVEPGFSEKRYGFSGFLQFCKGARTRGIIDLRWDDDAGDYVVSVG